MIFVHVSVNVGLPLIAQLVKNHLQSKRPSLIPGWGRSAREGLGYPLWYSQTSLVAQLVKNLSAMQETWVPSLNWKEGNGYPLQYTGLENSTESTVLGVANSPIWLRDFHFFSEQIAWITQTSWLKNKYCVISSNRRSSMMYQLLIYNDMNNNKKIHWK